MAFACSGIGSRGGGSVALPLPADIRSLVRTDQSREPALGRAAYPWRVLKLGIQRYAQSSAAKYMVRRRGPPSQGWKTFIRNHAPDIAAIDLFVVPTIDFKLLYGLAIIRLGRRRLGVDQRHRQPNLRMDCSPDHRGFPMGRGTPLPCAYQRN